MGSPSDIEPLLATMRRAAEDSGRDPSLIEVTAMCTERRVDAVTREAEGFAAVGVHRVTVPAARRTLSSFRVRSSRQESVDFVGHPVALRRSHGECVPWTSRCDGERAREGTSG